MENFNISDFLFYFFIGWLIVRLIALYLERKNEELRQDIEEITRRVKQKIVVVNVEKHGDCFYLFDKETDQFLVQGKTVNEIREAMEKRFPGRTFMANEEHLKELGLEF